MSQSPVQPETSELLCKDTKVQPETSELSHEDAEEYISQQKAMAETVESLARQLQRVRVTRAERIDSFRMFEAQGPASHERQKYITTQSAKAHENIDTQGHATAQDRDALVDELLISLNNDLMLSEPTESYFGIVVPNTTVKVDLSDTHISDELTGLLVYRTWQLLVRTPHGRRALINAVAQDNVLTTEISADVTNVDSYSQIHSIIATALSDNRITQLLKAATLQLPYPTQTQMSLSAVEKSHILQQIKENVLEVKTLLCL
jgi:hypothetical protein